VTAVSNEFCVVCGRTDRPLDEGVCPDCFADRHALVRAAKGATVTLCPTCGSRESRGRWIPSEAGKFLGAEDLSPFLDPHPEAGIPRVHWTEVGAEANHRSYEGEVTVRFRGIERVVPVELQVKVIARTCPDCSRKAGHFYTAQIQLRGPEGRLPPGARNLRARLRSAWDAVIPDAKPSWRKALSWGEELPEGWDFFLTDTLAARAIGKLMKHRLNASVKESATLWGRKDGRDVYRVTVCIRLPAGAARGPSDDPDA
jgi:nonsense-mediated mRNA decay protein 3